MEQQARIKELETKLTELENIEIVDIVRGLSIPLDDLSAILQSLKGGAIPALSTSGQVGAVDKGAQIKETGARRRQEVTKESAWEAIPGT